MPADTLAAPHAHRAYLAQLRLINQINTRAK